MNYINTEYGFKKKELGKIECRVIHVKGGEWVKAKQATEICGKWIRLCKLE